MDEDWADLTPAQQQAAKVLGYTQKSWDGDGGPGVCDEDWDDMTDAQKKAAQVLGYTKALWDETEEPAPPKQDKKKSQAPAAPSSSSSAPSSSSPNPPPASTQFRMGHGEKMRGGPSIHAAGNKRTPRVTGPEVDAYQRKIENDGFAVLKHVFTPDQIQKLRAVRNFAIVLFCILLVQ